MRLCGKTDSAAAELICAHSCITILRDVVKKAVIFQLSAVRKIIRANRGKKVFLLPPSAPHRLYSVTTLSLQKNLW
jgi:hypothetical protein